LRSRVTNLVSVIALSGILASCGIEEGGLSPEERYTVDTLYVKQLNDLRADLDSTCKARNEAAFRHIADSIKAVRMEEIKNLLTKNHTTQ